MPIVDWTLSRACIWHVGVVMDSVAVSIVTFNGKEFLLRCLTAVLSQTYQPIEIHLLDNASTDGTVEFVSRNFPTVDIISSDVNLGFAGGHNAVIRKTRTSFVLALNQDAYISPTFVEELIDAMKAHPNVGIAGGKLYSLRNTPTSINNENIIDMTWLDIEKKRRQVCYAQLQLDSGQCAVPKFVFAIDGAAMLLRRSMLEGIEVEHEFFDEDFFAGKEDLDLSWRGQLCGWKCLYVPSAIGWHLRTFTSADPRTGIADALKINSIRNRYLVMLKNDLVPHFLRHLPQIALYELKIMGYVLLRERSSLKGYAQAVRLFPRAIKKRKAIMRRKKVTGDYILRWFR
jgi:GT2 family glycosyltransferase